MNAMLAGLSRTPVLQRLSRYRADPDSANRMVPRAVHDVLRSPGQPIDAAARARMESQFGRDFSRVRIHADAQAAASARAVDAVAYTVGQHIAFTEGRYRPNIDEGRQLLAHELTHVAQQADTARSPAFLGQLTLDSRSSAAELEARAVAAGAAPGKLRQAEAPIVHRADPQAVRLTRQVGRTPRTGVQYWPTNVRDTVVGPVEAQGGLLGGGISRLHVIIGQNLTLNALAAELLPLWLTATPFTPPGALAPLPLDIITQDELAQALLVYNQTYLPVPAMTNWRAGFKFPLPAEIDEVTGVATLHPLLIRSLATAFDPAWTPLLSRHAVAIVASPPAAVAADVTAFLAREPDALGRGIELEARALTNARAELPFIRETFVQLGAAGFDVALAFMDNLVNREVQRLAAQRDGAAVLALVRAALAAAPVVRTAEQQASLDRANLMLGLVAGVAAAAPPVATRARAEKSLAVDLVKLDGSTHNPLTDLAVANAIFAQCDIRLSPGVNATATHAQTVGWLGGNTDLAASPGCGTASAEETAMFAGATAAFALGGRIRVFFPRTFTGLAGRGYSVAPVCAFGPAAAINRMAVVQNAGTERSLAHEIGHILLNPGPHQLAPTQNVMVPTQAAPLAERFTDADCATMYANVP